jgi:FeS assembly SUF system regulator
MLRITRQTDYAVVILTRFAQEGLGRIHTARDLAAETDVPLPTVSKILKMLARGGLLISQRGVKGGYRLARSPAEITVAEVIEAVEGPIAMTECAEASPGECDKEPWCPVRSNWQLINDAVHGALEGITLARMARPLEFIRAVSPLGAAALVEDEGDARGRTT